MPRSTSRSGAATASRSRSSPPGTAGHDGSLRPNAADQLVAGRVVDELADLGIDFHSPACAAACAAAVALRGATEALIAADAATGQQTTDRTGAAR